MVLAPWSRPAASQVEAQLLPADAGGAEKGCSADPRSGRIDISGRLELLFKAYNSLIDIQLLAVGILALAGGERRHSSAGEGGTKGGD